MNPPKIQTISVIGLGYVGLPVAVAFGKHVEVVGYDIDATRVASLMAGQDPSGEVSTAKIESSQVTFTSDPSQLANASFHIVAVPTPLLGSREPDLGPLLSASRTVGEFLKKGDIVVFESTVYPGCTEDECVPQLEAASGLTMGKDFFVAYSPERINPGDKVNTVETIVKVVGACDERTLDTVARTYELVVQAGTHRAPSIRVAEASKIIENTQRDVNIALVNELSIICDKVGIDTLDVLEAAATKWNFQHFKPGLVGGHCIGVDPYYLTWKANKLGYHARVINSGRYVNDSMGFYVGKQTVKRLLAKGINPLEANVLVMGLTFKENVADIRNTKVIDVVRELESFNVKVDVLDPKADADEVRQEYDLELVDAPRNEGYDAVVVAVNHDDFTHFTHGEFARLLKNGQGTVVDVKGVFRGKTGDLDYWSL